MSQTKLEQKHPLDSFLREDRLPHIWCPGCGLGTVLRCFLSGLFKSRLSLDKIVMVSGIGCTGRAAGYVKMDSFHTTHGRAIPFATGLKLANQGLKIVVFSGDGDLVSIGGNHFIHAARRNMDITVICVNNLNYGMTGGQMGPTTPLGARTATSPYGNAEPSFNIPNIAIASGAVYVARWTAMHVRRLEATMKEALLKRGFSLIEVISPCPTTYGRRNGEPTGIDQMRYYRDHSITKNGADPKDIDITLGGDIVVGKFVDAECPTFSDRQKVVMEKTFGSQV
ncbi:thiamine pyrophosphate-dependent enzyme [Chloroflexota bacterium]